MSLSRITEGIKDAMGDLADAVPAKEDTSEARRKLRHLVYYVTLLEELELVPIDRMEALLQEVKEWKMKNSL